MLSNQYCQPLAPAEFEALVAFLDTSENGSHDLAVELLMLLDAGTLQKVPTHCRLLYNDMLRLQAGGGPGYIAQLCKINLAAPLADRESAQASNVPAIAT